MHTHCFEISVCFGHYWTTGRWGCHRQIDLCYNQRCLSLNLSVDCRVEQSGFELVKCMLVWVLRLVSILSRWFKLKIKSQYCWLIYLVFMPRYQITKLGFIFSPSALEAQVILYSGEPPSHRLRHVVVEKIPFYFGDLVLQCSQTGCQTECMSPQTYSKFFLTLRTLPYWAKVALKKQKSVKNAHIFALIADQQMPGTWSYILGQQWFSLEY